MRLVVKKKGISIIILMLTDVLLEGIRLLFYTMHRVLRNNHMLYEFTEFNRDCCSKNTFMI